MIIIIYKGTFAPFHYGNIEILKIISQFISKLNQGSDFQIWIQPEEQERVITKFENLYSQEERKYISGRHNYLNPETFNFTNRLLSVIIATNFIDSIENINQIRVIDQPIPAEDLVEEALDTTDKQIYWITSKKIDAEGQFDDLDYPFLKKYFKENILCGISIENLFEFGFSNDDTIRKTLNQIFINTGNESEKEKVFNILKTNLGIKEVYTFLTCRIVGLISLTDQKRQQCIKTIKSSDINPDTFQIIHLKDYYYPKPYRTLIEDISDYDYRDPSIIDQTRLIADIITLSTKYINLIIEGSQLLDLKSITDICCNIQFIESDLNQDKFQVWRSRQHQQTQEEWIKFSNYWDQFVVPQYYRSVEKYQQLPSWKK
jgi:hypothetical protein